MPFRDIPGRIAVRPLSAVAWPSTEAHAPGGVQSRFRANLKRSYDALVRELDALGAQAPVLYIPLDPGSFDADDHPINGAEVTSSAIMLEFQANGHTHRYGADHYTTWPENLRAIVLTLEALRAVDRYGLTKHGEQYLGFIHREHS